MPTPRQKQILDFIEERISKRGVSPTHQEIGKHFKLSSVATVHEHLQALQKKGYLTRRKGQARSMTPQTKHPDLISIPLLGIIAAGVPIEAIENKETIAIPRNQLPLFDKIYALKVSGQSMVDEDIEDGDIVIVRRQETAKDGDKVVALLNNSEATLKTFYRGKRQIRLQPANKNFDPIIVNGDVPFAIQGVVIKILKRSASQETPLSSTPVKSTRPSSVGLNKIVRGDVLETMATLPSGYFDSIIVDPPYNIGKDFGNNIDRREMAEYVSWADQWMSESVRTLKPTGTMFVYGFSEILAHLSVKLPLHRQRWLIWHYTNKNVASLNFWQRSHESILCVWKEDRQFNRDAVREPYTEGFLNGAAGRIRKDTVGRFSKGGKQTMYAAHKDGALPRDVIKTPALAGGAGMMERWFLCKTCKRVYTPRTIDAHRQHNLIKHPTQKPFDLTRRLLKSCLPTRDGKVLIPFAGSGSECVVARELGADYFGIEINPDYVKLATGLLAQVR